MLGEKKELREKFLNEQWTPFIEKLKKIEKTIENKTRLYNAPLEKRMPTQLELLRLSTECLTLSEKWYGVGKGNLSCFYYFFIKFSEKAGNVFNDYQSLPKEKSNDGFIILLDMDTKQKQEKIHFDTIRQPYFDKKGLWKGGRSAIDNTVLRTISSQNSKYSKTLLFMLAKRFPKIKAHIVKDKNSIFYAFETFVRDNPGTFFTLTDEQKKLYPDLTAFSPKKLHWLLQSAGLWSNRLLGVSRTTIENLTPSRYFPLSWKRTHALRNIIKGKEILVREQGLLECSRVRANQGAYQPSHGLSMNNSGLDEGLMQHGTLRYNLGIPIDPTASISNEHCDIEKILREVYFLNPKGSATSATALLPGDGYLTVGQNSLTGSSIKITQHTQVYSGAIHEFPIYHKSKAIPLMMLSEFLAHRSE